MNLIDAAQAALSTCGLLALGLAIFTTIMLSIMRPDHRTPRHIVVYFVVSLIVYFLFFMVGLWLTGTVVIDNRLSQ